MSQKQHYYINDKIYFESRLQPPKKIMCRHLTFSKSGQFAHFYDDDGDEYNIPVGQIHVEGEDSKINTFNSIQEINLALLVDINKTLKRTAI